MAYSASALSFMLENLAKAGVHLAYNREAMRYPGKIRELVVHKRLNVHIDILKLFPGITPKYINAVLGYVGLKGLILETYEAGNTPAGSWFLDRIKKAVDQSVLILDVTQCNRGNVELGRYETSGCRLNICVISGYSIATEAATSKTMVLLEQNLEDAKVKMLLNKSLKGEITLP